MSIFFPLQKSAESFTDVKTTGIAMLFSAGTFLYVATVHVLPEVSSGQIKHTNPDGTIVIHEHKGFKNVELVAIVVGAILPVILSLGHKHWRVIYNGIVIRSISQDIYKRLSDRGCMIQRLIYHISKMCKRIKSLQLLHF